MNKKDAKKKMKQKNKKEKKKGKKGQSQCTMYNRVSTSLCPLFVYSFFVLSFFPSSSSLFLLGRLNGGNL